MICSSKMSTTRLPQIISLGRNLKEKCTKTAEITYQSLIEVVETLSMTLDISYYWKERKGIAKKIRDF